MIETSKYQEKRSDISVYIR